LVRFGLSYREASLDCRPLRQPNRKKSLLGVPEFPAPRLKIPCSFHAETQPKKEKLG
jgi:hypothetical protein